MCFTFKKNNKQTKKPVNCFLQDDASAGIRSLQTSIAIKPMERTIEIHILLSALGKVCPLHGHLLNDYKR